MPDQPVQTTESRLAEYERADREDRGAGIVTIYVDHRSGRIGIAPGNITWQECEDLLDAVRGEVKRLARAERQQQEAAEREAQLKRELEARVEAEIKRRMAERGGAECESDQSMPI